MSTPKFETLLLEQSGSILTITVNRPDKLNALNLTVLTELKDALIYVNSDKEYKIKGINLTGSGEKAFVAGADISQMSKMSPKEGKDMGKLGQEVSVLFERLRVPVIGCVNGFALGGGTELAISCDFLLATKNATFGQPEVKLGLIPGFGGTQRLARFIGRPRAKELIYTGRHINAEEALRIGLVLSLFDTKAQMLEEATRIHTQIQLNSPLAVGASKRAINEGGDLDIVHGLNIELEHFLTCFSSQDKVEGTTAFVEKRKPQFQGK